MLEHAGFTGLTLPVVAGFTVSLLAQVPFFGPFSGIEARASDLTYLMNGR